MQTLRRLALVWSLALLTSCAYGAHSTSIKIPDGTLMHYAEFRQRGEGVQISVVDSFRCSKEFEDSPLICNPHQHTAASGNSLIVSLFNGAGTAILGSAALGVPAAVLRPDQTAIRQQGGGASAASDSTGGEASSASTATGGIGGNSSATQQQTASPQATGGNATQMQRQSQDQGQTQTTTSAPRTRRHRR